MFRKKTPADPLSGGGGLKVEKINAEKTIYNLWHKRGWLKLSERRDLHKLVLFFKIAPLYLSNLLHPIVEDLSSYRLQNAGNYGGANTRTYADPFLPSTIQAWNNLLDSVRSADTLASYSGHSQSTQKIFLW